MARSKKVVALSVTVVLLSMLIIGFAASYAYFKVDPISAIENNANEVEITTIGLDLNFTTSQTLNNNRMVLLKEDEVVSKSEKALFTISKKDDYPKNIRYNIYFTDFVISQNMISEDFRWALLENGSIIYTGSFADAVSGADFKLTTSPILLTENSASYELRVWLQETEYDQSSLFNGTFSGKIMIEGLSAPNN